MNRDKRRWLNAYLCLSVFICGSMFSRTSGAQARREGLDALNDDAMMNDLALRGLNSLLERAFEVNKVPESQRQAQRTLIAMSRLSDPKAPLTSVQRQQLLTDAVRGVEQALPTLNDPNLLMRQAFVLITQGAEREVNVLEYWGPNPRTQATLRPIMQAVSKLLEKATERAQVLTTEAANKITAPNSPFAAQFDQYERLAVTAEYTRRMADYYLCLSLDPASSDRNRIASEAFDYLKQYDVPENADRCFVRNRMAKLAMVRNDFDTARQLFNAVIEDTGDPKPTVAQVYEARYFLAVTELLSKNIPAATSGLQGLIAWQAANLPNDKAARDGADAAATMLRYRIASAQAEMATDPAAKSSANQAAVSILMDLLTRRPDLRGVIYDQLLPKLDENADLATVEPLLLRALISRAEQELQKPRTTLADEKALQRGADAAREVVRRKAGEGIDASMMDASSLLLPFFLDRLNRKPDAASLFLDYVQQYRASNPKNATLALDNAQSIIGELRSNPVTKDDSAVTLLYERFLPLAIAAPFDRRQFAFEYARRLQLNGEAQKAIEYYRLVPADDNRSLQASFLELVALKQLLDDAPAESPQRPQLLSDIQKLADTVNVDVERALSAATTDEQRVAARSMRVRSVLLAADLARREQKNPQRALQLLQGFEQSLAGLPSPDALANEAIYIRVQSYMAASQYTQATEELVKLLNKTEGAQGAQIVYNLLEKLNGDFDRAQQINDTEAMRSLARSRAQLSGFLVTWAEQNADAGIRKFTYRYKVFDAETQRRAAELETDVSQRQQLLNTALQRYQALQSADGVALYKASLPAEAASDPQLFDPAVSFGIALVQYDLGDYEHAADSFSTLITQRELGSPVLVTEENGVQRSIDNDQYWEAVLKLVRSDQKLNREIENAKNFLKLQMVTWGPHFGGKKWKKEFDALRAELIPGFEVAPVVPTTQP